MHLIGTEHLKQEESTSITGKTDFNRSRKEKKMPPINLKWWRAQKAPKRGEAWQLVSKAPAEGFFIGAVFMA
eukprot:scaffold17427_cov54-Cylindrotheca_fusiformis.AAC.1